MSLSYTNEIVPGYFESTNIEGVLIHVLERVIQQSCVHLIHLSCKHYCLKAYRFVRIRGNASHTDHKNSENI